MKTRHIIAALMLSSLLMPTALLAQKKTSAPSKPQQITQDSINVIINKAKAGDAVAQNTLGNWYYAGKGVKQDYKEALKWWALSAKQDNIDAIGNMGMCYQYGRGTEKDSVLAMKLYDKAITKGNKALFEQHVKLADQGKAFNAVYIAECYENGVGTSKDKKKALEYYDKAATAGSVYAVRKAAMGYLNGKDAKNAAKWFKVGSAHNDITCVYYYAKLLIDGNGVAQDKQKGAIEMLKAAERNFPAAQNAMGELYSQGNGVTRNEETASKWYLRGAQNNHPNAMWSVAERYMNGTGVPVDYNLAMIWYSKTLATPGFATRFANSANDTEKGTIIKNTAFMDYIKGMKSYLISKDYDAAGVSFKNVEKTKNIAGTTMQGVCLITKDYGKYNPKKGMKLLEKAAATDPLAQYYLGKCYESGTGVAKDTKKAIELYQKAAKGGLCTAKCYLADMYYEGRGTDKDLVSAFTLYSEAYNENQITSSGVKHLAACYENGYGTSVNKAKAEEISKTVVKDYVPELLKLVK